MGGAHTRELVAAALAVVLASCSLDDAGTGPVSGSSSGDADGAGGAGSTTSSGATTAAGATASTSQGGAAPEGSTVGTGGGGAGGEASGGGAGGAGGSSPTCGDGILEAPEECDGPAPCDRCMMVCPPGWTQGATGTCYGRAESDGDGDEVVDACDATRDQLAIDDAVVLRPATPDVLADLTTVALVCGDELDDDGCWIGADDLDVEGTFRWVSGEPFTYAGGVAPWAEGEPSADDEDESCVEVYAPDGGDRPLHDEQCWQWQRVICEIVPPGELAPPAP